MTLAHERLGRTPEADISVPVHPDVLKSHTKLERDEAGREYYRRHVTVYDESEEHRRHEMDMRGDIFEAYLQRNPDLPSPTASNDFSSNLAAEWLYLEDPDQTSMREWSKLFPRAKALYPLQRIQDGGRVLPGGKLDERAQDLFLNMLDARAIRARARVMANMVEQIAAETDDDVLHAISLGCGAAVPDIDATLKVQRELGKDIKWHLYDTDPDALSFAQQLGREAGLPDDALVFDRPKAWQRIKEEAEGSADVIDVLGLWEYLTPKQCAELLKRSYPVLRSGGAIIASNMLSTRPQLQFNLRGVGWPDIIKPRSEAELVEIVDAAGIDTRQLTFATSQDGVYGVMEIRKP